MTPAEIRAALRRNASRWVAQLYRHDILVARTVRGLEIEAGQEFDAQVVKPLLRAIGASAAVSVGGRDLATTIGAIQAEATAAVRNGVDAVRRVTTERLAELTRAESEWVSRSVSDATGAQVPPITVAQEQAVLDRPILGARTEEWFRDSLAGDTGRRVRAWIDTGIRRGLSTDEIVHGLSGTRTQAGILDAPRAQAAALVRTAAASVSAGTRFESFKSIGVDKWRWVATLDLKTCPICGANEKGSPYDMGAGPTFPAHVNCRCTPVPWFGEPIGTRASIDGQVPAKVDFEAWIRDQGPAAQDQVFGRARAEAFRAGDLDLAGMLGKDLQPLTLEELRAMDRI